MMNPMVETASQVFSGHQLGDELQQYTPIFVYMLVGAYGSYRPISHADMLLIGRLLPAQLYSISRQKHAVFVMPETV